MQNESINVTTSRIEFNHLADTLKMSLVSNRGNGMCMQNEQKLYLVNYIGSSVLIGLTVEWSWFVIKHKKNFIHPCVEIIMRIQIDFIQSEYRPTAMGNSEYVV